MSIMNLSINKFVEYLKLLKSEYTIFHKKCIIGMDRLCGYIKFIPIDDLDTGNGVRVYPTDQLMMMCISTETKKPIDGEVIIDSIGNISINGIYIPSIDTNPSFVSAIYNFNTLSLFFPSIDDEEITDNETISLILNLSAKDGMRWFKYKGYNMTLYKSLININKSDQLYLTIYDDPCGRDIFHSIFRTYKKKGKLSIYTYFKFLKMG